MSNVMYKSFSLLFLLFCFSTMAAADWKDLWKTPQQQALQAYENAEYESLITDSPDDSWSALGQFKTENYQQASESFAAQVDQLRAAGDNEAATRALYNQGVSDVMAGQFESAIERFDEALVDDPSMAAAQRNRSIAQQLLELQQQNESEQNGEQSEEGEQGEEGEQSEDGESSEQQQGEPGDTEQSADQSGEPGESAEEESAGQQSEQDDSAESGSQGEDDTDPADQSEAQKQQDAEDAREALAAEAAQAGQQGADDQGDGTEELSAGGVTEQPLSEAEQATEQLLRRIPDDPAGLLRRKLEQSHRSEYPEVRNAAEPW